MTNNLRKRRIEMGLLTGEITARRLRGMTRPVYSMIETGRVLPNQDDLWQLCELFGASPYTLFGASLDLLIVQQRWEQEHGQPTAQPKKRQGNRELRTRLDDNQRDRLIALMTTAGYKDFGDLVRRMLLPALEARVEATRASAREDIA